jgi:hypothetical protein
MDMTSPLKVQRMNKNHKQSLRVGQADLDSQEHEISLQLASTHSKHHKLFPGKICGIVTLITLFHLVSRTRLRRNFPLLTHSPTPDPPHNPPWRMCLVTLPLLLPSRNSKYSCSVQWIGWQNRARNIVLWNSTIYTSLNSYSVRTEELKGQICAV